MRQPTVPPQLEVHPLNRELMSFDLESVEVEELERRFEMALAQPPPTAPPASPTAPIVPDACSGCPHLVACGTFCAPPPPQTDAPAGQT
jgi:hypothetical protein